MSAAETCLEKRLHMPALILLYSAIDISGWLACLSDNKPVRDAFCEWVDKYMLPANQLSCTSLDLYAARCGLLHTFTPESRYSSTGDAKLFAYAWGKAKVADLRKSIELQGRTDLIAIHVSDLLEAYRLGLARYLTDVDNDPSLGSTFDLKAGKFFAPMSTRDLDAYLDATGCTDPVA
ncbi:MAG: hypothetical protein NTY23_11225 [Chloroflexi bacterium]|nr:hypothetical protein [Chloroflexota bacterium]